MRIFDEFFELENILLMFRRIDRFRDGLRVICTQNGGMC